MTDTEPKFPRHHWSCQAESGHTTLPDAHGPYPPGFEVDMDGKVRVTDPVQTPQWGAMMAEAPAGELDALRSRLARTITERDVAVAENNHRHSAMIAALNALYGFGFVSGCNPDRILSDLSTVTGSLRARVDDMREEISRLKDDLVIARDGHRPA